jgi:hypothetical protein
MAELTRARSPRRLSGGSRTASPPAGLGAAARGELPISRALAEIAAARDQAAVPASLFAAAAEQFVGAAGLGGAVLAPGTELPRSGGAAGERRGLADPEARQLALGRLVEALRFIGDWARERGVNTARVYVSLLGQLYVEDVPVFEDFALESEARAMPDGSIEVVPASRSLRFESLRDVAGEQIGPNYPGRGASLADRRLFETWLFWWTLVLTHFAPPLFGLAEMTLEVAEGRSAVESPTPTPRLVLPEWRVAALLEKGEVEESWETAFLLSRRFDCAATFLSQVINTAHERLESWGCLPLAKAAVITAGRLGTILSAHLSFP